MAREVSVVNGFVNSFDETTVSAYILEDESLREFKDNPPFDNGRHLFRATKLFKGMQFCIVTSVRPGEMMTTLFVSEYSKPRQLFNFCCYMVKVWRIEFNIFRLQLRLIDLLYKLNKTSRK